MPSRAWEWCEVKENHKLVLPEHMNHFGFLFGGYLLKWIDEFAWITASLDYPGHQFVTVAMDRVEFHCSVRVGAVLRFECERTREGQTSVTYEVRVHRVTLNEDESENLPVFSNQVTFVRVDENGEKRLLDAASS